MSTRSSFFLRPGRDLAIDLGTTSTLIHRQGRGVVLDEPSVVAVAADTGEVVAAGTSAREMLGRTPGSIRAERPLRGGAVHDPDVTEQMLRVFTDSLKVSTVLRPRVVVCVPSTVSPLERRAVEDVAIRVGARRVFVVEEPVVAAIGAGLPVTHTEASTVVDIGGGSTDAAILALGGVVASRSTRVGGEAMDEAIGAHVQEHYSLVLGERSAEHIKVEGGSAFPLARPTRTRVRGRDLVTGLPRTVEVGSDEVRRALDGPVRQVVDLVRGLLDACPPELAGDVLTRGVVLTGGGALLRGLDARMEHELGVPVRVADDPLRAVIRGAGRCVDDFATLEPVLVDGRRF
ncbi:rod shape-determining protein [Marihabitans asiaticum]|uniref:Cell shape-determining protein MreB n=1 Tax=Marihabitans asiaticum TaxID=415218 RepID=A0A560W7U1_9MICO|nr:rod shape-determining protein [Marihabitans asiaticum]TWD13706.1 rod shape-determining protein MreB [Marihabitans asiaticum]